MKLIYCISLVFILTNCSMDEPVYTVEYYENIDQSSTFPCDTTPETGFIVSSFSRDINWGRPFFNPNNRNEIVYRRTSEGPGTEVWGFNIHSGASWKVADNNGYQPIWSSSEKILVVKTNNQIYSYDSDGSNEKKLTKNGINTFPSWHPDGDKIAFTSTEYYTNKMIHIIDGSGEVLDTLSFRNSRFPTWSPCGNKLAFGNSDSLKVYDFKTDSVNVIQIDKFCYYITWLNEREILWWNGGNIYKTNINTKSTQFIRATCWNRSYGAISVSGNKKYLITQTTSSKLIGKDSIYSESNIHLIDLETDEEVKLLVY